MNFIHSTISWSILFFGKVFVIGITIFPFLLDAQDLTEKANSFLNSLSPALKAKTQFTFEGNERFNWHYVPKTREGITFADFNEKQKTLAITLLRASLSEQGYQKTTEVIELEKVLRMLENRSVDDKYRDPLNYHFTIFGKPTTDGIWGWRLEGHHLSLNFLSTEGKIVSSTPTFFGSNPGIVPSGKEKGKQVLKQETDLAFALIGSLSADQLRQAVISENAPGDIISGNKRKAELLKPRGIQITELRDDQRKLFLQLLTVYIKNYTTEFSKKLKDKIDTAGIDSLYFAWAGSLHPGAGHYYRIQSPVVLIEYDNTQNNANHVHTVVRDLTNDFGEDVLKEHYRKHHH